MIKRRNYFIDKKFQAIFALKFILLLIVEIAFISGIFIWISGNTFTTGYTNSMLTIEKTSSYFLFPMTIIIVISSVVVGVTGMFVFIMMSHKIAGPLYRFEKDLTDVSHGDFTKRITTREADQLADIREALNALIVNCDVRIIRMKRIISELKKLSESEAPGNTEKIRDAISELSKEADHFKVTSG